MARHPLTAMDRSGRHGTYAAGVHAKVFVMSPKEPFLLAIHACKKNGLMHES